MKKLLTLLLICLLVLGLGACRSNESSNSLANQETQEETTTQEEKKEEQEVIIEETKQEDVVEETKEEIKEEVKEDKKKEINPEVLKTYKYWVVFYDQNGNELQREAIKYGTVPTYWSDIPYYDDGTYWYKGVGWTDKWGREVKEFKPITGNTKFYAKYEKCGEVSHGGGGSSTPTPPPTPSTFTVFFDVGGIGIAPADITGLSSGSTITKPAAPTDVANSFCGWYKDSGYSTKWIFVSDTVTANTILYAKWHASATPCSNNRPYLLHLTSIAVPGIYGTGEYYKYDETIEQYVKQGNYAGAPLSTVGWFHVNNCNSTGYSGGAAIACTDIDCHDHN